MRRDRIRDLFCVQAGATGIVPSASNFGGTDIQARLGLEDYRNALFGANIIFIKGIFCLFELIYIELCKLARKTYAFERFIGWSFSLVLIGLRNMCFYLLLVSPSYPSWNWVNMSTPLFLPMVVNGWRNQQEYPGHDLICESWEVKANAGDSRYQKHGLYPQVLLHVFSGQPFLIHIELDNFHRVVGRLNRIVLRFIVTNEQRQ